MYGQYMRNGVGDYPGTLAMQTNLIRFIHCHHHQYHHLIFNLNGFWTALNDFQHQCGELVTLTHLKLENKSNCSQLSIAENSENWIIIHFQTFTEFIVLT